MMDNTLPQGAAEVLRQLATVPKAVLIERLRKASNKLIELTDAYQESRSVGSMSEANFAKNVSTYEESLATLKKEYEANVARISKQLRRLKNARNVDLDSLRTSLRETAEEQRTYALLAQLHGLSVELPDAVKALLTEVESKAQQ